MKYVKACTIDTMLTIWGNPFMIFTGITLLSQCANFIFIQIR
jgi:hypothetical protein